MLETSFLRKLTIGVFIVAALLGLAYGTTLLMASRAEQQLDAAWSRLDHERPFVPRTPVPVANGVAWKLQSLGPELGVSMGPAGPASLPPAREPAKAFDACREAMSSWLNAQLERPAASIEPPPPAVAAYLDLYGDRIDAVARLLVAEGKPLWPVSAKVELDQPMPNMATSLQLARILVASSLAAESRGDHDRAARCQEASWRLAEGLLSRPELISQLLGIAAARQISGVQRKLDMPLPAWFSELATFDYEGALVSSMHEDSVAVGDMLRAQGSLEATGLGPGGSGISGRLLRLVWSSALKPAVRRAVAKGWTEAVDDVARLRHANPCEASEVGSARRPAEELSIPLFGSEAVADLRAPYMRVSSLRAQNRRNADRGPRAGARPLARRSRSDWSWSCRE